MRQTTYLTLRRDRSVCGARAPATLATTPPTQLTTVHARGQSAVVAMCGRSCASARATNAEELDLYAQNRTTYQRATMISLGKSHRAAPKVILGPVQLSWRPVRCGCVRHTRRPEVGSDRLVQLVGAGVTLRVCVLRRPGLVPRCAFRVPMRPPAPLSGSFRHREGCQ